MLNPSENQYIARVHHYWDYLCRKLLYLDSVKFIHFDKNLADKSVEEKGLGWLLVAILKIEDLKEVFNTIFNDQEFLMLYDVEQSHVWKSRKEILECIDQLETKYSGRLTL